MKKSFILTAIAVLLAVASATAQQIAVVSEGGETSIFQTFQAAIECADPGSVIYLPGGGFPLSDEVKITKRLTIIGIGHKSNNDNVDGVTTISGNIFFNEGSSGSAVMGCYITGNVNIGESNASVNNVMVKCCNLNSVQVYNNNCIETLVSQNYVRSSSNFGETNAIVKNNVLYSIGRVYGGSIISNVILNGFNNYNEYVHYEYSGIYANYTIIKHNIIPCKNESHGAQYYATIRGEYNTIDTNMCRTETGENCINIGDLAWEDLFVDYKGISSASDFHFKDGYKQYENMVGVYSGDVDFDKQMAPVPYIVAKRIAEETDAAGQLKIQVRVKAGE